jgi:succinate dehydrogenase / fumarate reductase flavoprotein subunit
LGIDITQGPVEVGPVAHSFMGGFRIQEDGSTNVPGLYAAGEVAGGIWGANRIAGTGGTEILVFGKIAGRAASSYAGSALAHKPTENFFVPDGDRDPSAVFPKIQRILADGGGLGRNQAGLDRGVQELEKIEDELKHINTRPLSRFLTYMSAANGWAVAKMVLTAARQRKETRGFHKRLDYPQKNNGEFLGNFIVQKGNDHQLTVRFVPNHG